MNLSKSKYCNGIQCKKMLWLDKYKSNVKEDIDNSAITGIYLEELEAKMIEVETK